MPDKVEALSCNAPISSFGTLGSGSVISRWCELGLVVLFATGPFLLNSIHVYWYGINLFGERANAGWTFPILHEIAVLLLLGYVVKRRRIRWRDLGFCWSIRSILIGFPLAFASYVAYWVAYHFLLIMHSAFWPAAPFTPEPSAPGGTPALLSVLFLCINPFFEELIVRAYLMTEVKALTGSWKPAIVLSTLIQASYHIYYGWIVMLALVFQFLVFSLYYARKQQAAPLIVAHGFFDLYWVFLGLL